MLAPFAREVITVSNTAVGLTAATYQPSSAQCAVKADIMVEGGEIRIRLDGTDPTSLVGDIYKPGNKITLESIAEIVQFKSIRRQTSDATLGVTYYRKQ